MDWPVILVCAKGQLSCPNGNFIVTAHPTCTKRNGDDQVQSSIRLCNGEKLKWAGGERKVIPAPVGG